MSTCCRSISPSSLSSQSGAPDLLLDQDLLAQILLIASSICSFPKAASPRNVNISSANSSLVGPRPTVRRRQAPSRPLRSILFWVQSSTGRCRPSWSCPKLLFSTCFLSSVLVFWQGLFVAIHPRTCPWVFFTFHVLVQLVALLFSPKPFLPASLLLDSPRSRLGPARFQFPRGPHSARSEQGEHCEGSSPLMVATFLARTLQLSANDTKNHRHIIAPRDVQ